MALARCSLPIDLLRWDEDNTAHVSRRILLALPRLVLTPGRRLGASPVNFIVTLVYLHEKPRRRDWMALLLEMKSAQCNDLRLVNKQGKQTVVGKVTNQGRENQGSGTEYCATQDRDH